MGDLERDGHFLNNFDLIFKHKPFIIRHLIKRPNYSTTYPCPFAKPKRVGGIILQCYIIAYLSPMFLLLIHLGVCLRSSSPLSIPISMVFKVKNLENNHKVCTPQVNSYITLDKVFYNTINRIHKYYTHIIFVRR